MRQRIWPAVVPLVALLVTACGSNDAKPQVATAGGKATASTDQQTSTLSDEEKMRKFAACMKENGADIVIAGPGDVMAGSPDEAPPKAGGKGGGKAQALDDDPKFKKAIEACRQYEPSGGDLPKPSADDLAKLREFTKCMRENGVDLPDPDPGDGGGAIPLGDGVNPNSSAFKKANEACRQLAPVGRGGGASVGRAG